MMPATSLSSDVSTLITISWYYILITISWYYILILSMIFNYILIHCMIFNFSNFYPTQDTTPSGRIDINTLISLYTAWTHYYSHEIYSPWIIHTPEIMIQYTWAGVRPNQGELTLYKRTCPLVPKYTTGLYSAWSELMRMKREWGITHECPPYQQVSIRYFHITYSLCRLPLRQSSPIQHHTPPLRRFLQPRRFSTYFWYRNITVTFMTLPSDQPTTETHNHLTNYLTDYRTWPLFNLI